MTKGKKMQAPSKAELTEMVNALAELLDEGAAVVEGLNDHDERLQRSISSDVPVVLVADKDAKLPIKLMFANGDKTYVFSMSLDCAATLLIDLELKLDFVEARGL